MDKVTNTGGGCADLGDGNESGAMSLGPGVGWEAMRLEFVHGSMSAEELAERHGVKAPTVRKRAQRDGWREQRLALSRAVALRADEVAIETKAPSLAEFNAEDLRLAQSLRGEVFEALEESRKPGGFSLSPRDLNALAATAERAQRMGRLALGVSTDNVGDVGPNGERPVRVADLTPEERRAALAVVLAEY